MSCQALIHQDVPSSWTYFHYFFVWLHPSILQHILYALEHQLWQMASMAVLLQLRESSLIIFVTWLFWLSIEAWAACAQTCWLKAVELLCDVYIEEYHWIWIMSFGIYFSWFVWSVLAKWIIAILPFYVCRAGGTMVTYGGMARKPVTIPVVGCSYSPVSPVTLQMFLSFVLLCM